MAEIKQVIAVRTDLKMGKGKLAAQVAHASFSSAEESARMARGWIEEWKSQGQAKVVVKVSGEGELRDVMKRARSAGLPSVLIEDRGLTQLEPGTATCVGVGPAPAEAIDRITGKLKLL